MSVLRAITCLIIVSVVPVVATAQPPIGVSLQGSADETSYDGAKDCFLYFSIHNNSSPGTIERIDIGVEVFDDRGRKVELNMMSNTIQNRGDGFFAKRVPISVGKSMLRTEEVWAKENCQYISKWKLLSDEIENSDCSIRMFPEGIECSSLVGVQLK